VTPVGGHHHDLVAEVDGVPVSRREVEEVLARMRRGPAAGLLPRDGGAEGRQLRRWLVQLLTVERLLERTAAAHGWVGAEDGLELDQTAELELGSVLTAVLLSSPAARSVYRNVTDGVAIGEDEIAGYYRRNLVSLAEPEARLARLLVAGSNVHHGRSEQLLGWVAPDQLAGALGRAVAATAPGHLSDPIDVAGGRWVVAVDDVRAGRVPELAEVRGRIAAELGGAARRHAFVSWVERERQARVVLHEGYEHPADPRQPDNTHRH
jgi:[acyl-carrier-protein] S-malonyltransferase